MQTDVADRSKMLACFRPPELSEFANDVRCAWLEHDARRLVRMLLQLAPECEYKVRRLADKLNISERHLQRIFASMVQSSPRGWLKRQRLLAAKRQLLGASSVKEVAHGLGFRSVSHFSRDFRHQFGRSPSAYRW